MRLVDASACSPAAAAAAARRRPLMPGVVGPDRARRQAAPTLSGGNGTMYIGTYKGEIEIYDEATEKMVDKIALKTGIPRSLTPSPDRTRFYALNSRLRADRDHRHRDRARRSTASS